MYPHVDNRIQTSIEWYYFRNYNNIAALVAYLKQSFSIFSLGLNFDRYILGYIFSSPWSLHV